MDLEQWLIAQRQFYLEGLPDQETHLATHPVSGEWQATPYLKNQFWWGGGASQESWQQIEKDLTGKPELTHVVALTFGPVQLFLGAGQRLRDWAVASWLCHYLAGVLIHRWQDLGGVVLLPRYQGVELVEWLQDPGYPTTEHFWRAELPNVFTGLHPDRPGWIDDCKTVIRREWLRLIEVLEQIVVKQHPKLLNGIGWRVIRRDHACLWTVYAESEVMQLEDLSQQIGKLHQKIESRKLARQWQYPWWGGRTSPSAGSYSVWHPGLKPVDQGGTWGMPDEHLKKWWERVAEGSGLAGLFSSNEQLNSLEMVKRMASVPEIIRYPTKDLVVYTVFGNRRSTKPGQKSCTGSAVPETQKNQSGAVAQKGDHRAILSSNTKTIAGSPCSIQTLFLPYKIRSFTKSGPDPQSFPKIHLWRKQP